MHDAERRCKEIAAKSGKGLASIDASPLLKQANGIAL
jgi:hypothetical protein